MLSRAHRIRTGVAATVLLALTWLNVLAPDHTVWHVGADHGHAQHCHGAPATCSTFPVPSGPGQFLYTEPGVAAPELIVVGAHESGQPGADGLDVRPLAPPPRA